MSDSPEKYLKRFSEEEEAELDREMDEIMAGMIEAFDIEVETLRREGWPIYVEENGRIIDLQQNPRERTDSHQAP